MNRQPQRRGAGLQSLGVRPLLLAVLLAAGCRSAPGAGSLQDALRDYRAGRYLAAQQQAIRIHRARRGPEGPAAAYVAGLCAFERGDLLGARSWLERAARAGDPQTSGRAQAVLGLVLEQEGYHEEAAARFAAAARRLSGTHAQKAARHAALAHRAAGNETLAQHWLARADGEPGLTEDDQGFTLQLGAFQERHRAQDAAREAGAMATRHGLGPVRVLRRPDGRGQTLFLVQVGRFATRREAVDARVRLGRLQYIVVTATPPRT